MIVPDVNLLLYAHNRSSRFHKRTFSWWESSLNGNQTIFLPHLCINAFVRLMTHAKILETPLTVEEAFGLVDTWLESDIVSLIAPGPRHYSLYRSLLIQVGVGGKLTTDAYIAAIAMENQAVVFSNDNDFSRFSGLNWQNPLAA